MDRTLPKLNRETALEYFTLAAKRGHVEAQFRTGQLILSLAQRVGDAESPPANDGDDDKHCGPPATGSVSNAGTVGILAELNAGKQLIMEGGGQPASGSSSSSRATEGAVLPCHSGRQSVPSAISWLQKAAQTGHVDSMLALGNMYRQGESVAQDSESAAVYFSLAAERGDPTGQHTMAWLLLQGQSVPQDVHTAQRLFTAAAKQDHVDAKLVSENFDGVLSAIGMQPGATKGREQSAFAADAKSRDDAAAGSEHLSSTAPSDRRPAKLPDVIAKKLEELFSGSSEELEDPAATLQRRLSAMQRQIVQQSYKNENVATEISAVSERARYLESLSKQGAAEREQLSRKKYECKVLVSSGLEAHLQFQLALPPSTFAAVYDWHRPLEDMLTIMQRNFNTIPASAVVFVLGSERGAVPELVHGCTFTADTVDASQSFWARVGNEVVDGGHLIFATAGKPHLDTEAARRLQAILGKAVHLFDVADQEPYFSVGSQGVTPELREWFDSVKMSGWCADVLSPHRARCEQEIQEASRREERAIAELAAAQAHFESQKAKRRLELQGFEAAATAAREKVDAWVQEHARMTQSAAGFKLNIEPADDRLFAVSLTACKRRKSSLAGSDRLPHVVELCMSRIEQTGLRVEGIFRHPSNYDNVSELIKLFDHGGDNLNLADLANIKPPDAAFVVLRWLAQMPEPLIPFELFGRLQIATTVADLREIVQALPKPNAGVLRVLIALLVSVEKCAAENKMTAQRLSFAVTPAILWSSTQNPRIKYNWNAVEMMVHQYEFVFFDHELTAGQCSIAGHVSEGGSSHSLRGILRFCHGGSMCGFLSIGAAGASGRGRSAVADERAGCRIRHIHGGKWGWDGRARFGGGGSGSGSGTVGGGGGGGGGRGGGEGEGGGAGAAGAAGAAGGGARLPSEGSASEQHGQQQEQQHDVGHAWGHEMLVRGGTEVRGSTPGGSFTAVLTASPELHYARVWPGPSGLAMRLGGRHMKRSGCLVVKLTEEADGSDGPAKRSGVEPGFLLLELNGTAVQGYEHGYKLLAESPPGQAVEFLFERQVAGLRLPEAGGAGGGGGSGPKAVRQGGKSCCAAR